MNEPIRKYLNGFTLIEVLITVVIIGIISAAIYVNFNVARDQAIDDSLAAQLSQMRLALETYRSENGHYPGKDELTPAQGYPNTQCGGGVCTYRTNQLGTTPFIPFLIANNHISVLPDINTAQEFTPACIFTYFVELGTGTSYRITPDNCVTNDVVTSSSEFSRCPASCPLTNNCNPADLSPNYSESYGVYKGTNSNVLCD